MIVEVLHQQSPEDAADVIWTSSSDGIRRQLQQPEIGLSGQDFPGFRGEGWGHHAFQEQPGELTGCSSLHGSVDCHDAAERADAIRI